MNNWTKAKQIADRLIAETKIQNFKIRKKDYPELNNSFIVLNDILYQVSNTKEGKLGDSYRSVVKKISTKSGEEFALRITKSTNEEFDDNEIPALTLLDRYIGHFSREKTNTCHKQQIESYEFQYAYKKYIAMPIIKGTTLAKLDPSIFEHNRLKLAISFIEDLINLHEKGILPIDFLPQNIMVDPISLEVKIIDFETALILPPGTKETFSDNYFSSEVDLEFLNTYLPPENMQNEHFPSKIIVSIASNIWEAASIIKLFGFIHIAEQMQNKEPTQRPTLTDIKKQLQLIEEELKNENSPPAKKFKSV